MGSGFASQANGRLERVVLRLLTTPRFLPRVSHPSRTYTSKFVDLLENQLQADS
jgi:hypothetical protein